MSVRYRRHGDTEVSQNTSGTQWFLSETMDLCVSLAFLKAAGFMDGMAGTANISGITLIKFGPRKKGVQKFQVSNVSRTFGFKGYCIHLRQTLDDIESDPRT